MLLKMGPNVNVDKASNKYTGKQNIYIYIYCRSTLQVNVKWIQAVQKQPETEL